MRAADLEETALRVLGGARQLDMPSRCCRVCGSLALDGLYSHEICLICDWHEDGSNGGGCADCGPHYGVSFEEAKEHFRCYLTSRNPAEGQRFLRALPLRSLKSEFLALQRLLGRSAPRDIAQSARIYESMCEVLQQIRRTGVPAASLQQQCRPRYN